MAKNFSRPVLAAIDAAKIMGIKAGSEHKFIGVWPVVVDGRVYARSWGVSGDGWYHAFLEQPNGTIQIGDREIRVRAVRARSERIRDKVEEAYKEKFTTKASQKWVRGFRTPRRRDATIEFVPR
ncbi:MAG TPA: DUF2255 family protein [Vicinamibacterales bacterium]|nr:DUF2255 family protein [Vicinamibacterales bacterium]